MTALILPVAGKSSRFPEMRPKWLLTMNDGKLMFEYSIQKLDLEVVSRIVLVALAEHEGVYFEKKMIEKILSRYANKVDVVLLKEPTTSQSQTVAEGVKRTNIKGPIFVKDCDNVFTARVGEANTVAYVDLHDCEQIKPGNKSYIQFDRMNNVSNIVEKKIISEYFCCGGYQFASASEFVSTFHALQTQLPHKDEIYISHIIYQLILSGHQFSATKATDFIDIGTADEYHRINKNSAVIFCDVDGVLCENGSKFSDNGWNTPTINENVDYLVALQRKRNLKVVITTSRPSSERSDLEEKLKSRGLDVLSYVMDLPHAQRVLINDFAQTNNYPVAHAINIPRNARNLRDYLKWLEI